MKQVYGFFIIILCLNSCFFGDNVTSYNYLTKDFWLICFEDCKDQHIIISLAQNGTSGYHITEPLVYEVGFNEDFIIAKQHPTTLDENYRPIEVDTTKTNYIIVDIRNYISGDTESYTVHSLNKEGFQIMKDYLGVPDELTFTIKNMENEQF